MIDANPGDILDDAFPYNNTVYATLVIDPLATACSITKHIDSTTREASSEHHCPVCNGPVVNHVKAKHPHTQEQGRFSWCGSCWLIYNTVAIGVIDKHGNYEPYKESE